MNEMQVVQVEIGMVKKEQVNGELLDIFSPVQNLWLLHFSLNRVLSGINLQSGCKKSNK